MRSSVIYAAFIVWNNLLADNCPRHFWQMYCFHRHLSDRSLVLLVRVCEMVYYYYVASQHYVRRCDLGLLLLAEYGE